VPDNATDTSWQSDIDLERGLQFCRAYSSDSLFAQLAPNIRLLGSWDDYGVRLLPNEEGGFASAHFRIAAALPATFRSELPKISVQRILYTDKGPPACARDYERGCCRARPFRARGAGAVR
jgi:hypothetical protein